MTYALCPDNGPPRLWRFVAAGELGYEGGRPIVTILLHKDNLLLIDKELYDKQGELQQHMLLRTQDAYETV